MNRPWLVLPLLALLTAGGGRGPGAGPDSPPAAAPRPPEGGGRRPPDPPSGLARVLMQQIVGRVGRALASAAPPGQADYAANASAYRADLARLDGEYRSGLEHCQRRVIVTSHAAFGYLS